MEHFYNMILDWASEHIWIILTNIGWLIALGMIRIIQGDVHAYQRGYVHATRLIHQGHIITIYQDIDTVVESGECDDFDAGMLDALKDYEIGKQNG